MAAAMRGPGDLARFQMGVGAMIGAFVAGRPATRPVMGDPADPLSSFDLLLAAKDGDGEALGLLYERYLPRLRRFGHGRLPASCRGALDTNDLVQDVRYTFRQLRKAPLFTCTFARRWVTPHPVVCLPPA